MPESEAVQDIPEADYCIALGHDVELATKAKSSKNDGMQPFVYREKSSVP